MYCFLQRYIYRIDPTRMNEFGFSQKMEEDAKSNSVATTSGEVPAIADGEEAPATPKSSQDKKKD